MCSARFFLHIFTFLCAVANSINQDIICMTISKVAKRYVDALTKRELSTYDLVRIFDTSGSPSNLFVVSSYFVEEGVFQIFIMNFDNVLMFFFQDRMGRPASIQLDIPRSLG